MSHDYNFFAAHLKSNAAVTLTEVSGLLRQWFGLMQLPIERYGSPSGKVVKFSEKRYEKALLAPDSQAIDLFSERIHPREDCHEIMNCAASAIFSRSDGLLLSVSDPVADLDRLIASFFAVEGLAELFHYLYAYGETQGYGTGFGLGHYTPDELHPLMWEGRSQVGNWARIRRNAEDGRYLRDVMAFNGFTEDKLKALPAPKRAGLEAVMNTFGQCKELRGFYLWDMTAADQSAARKELIKHELLAAYIDRSTGPAV